VAPGGVNVWVTNFRISADFRRNNWRFESRTLIFRHVFGETILKIISSFPDSETEKIFGQIWFLFLGVHIKTWWRDTTLMVSKNFGNLTVKAVSNQLCMYFIKICLVENVENHNIFTKVHMHTKNFLCQFS
jgi:ABC-type microcin C transport system permease subunit YejB